jgi:hypothetical protein
VLEASGAFGHSAKRFLNNLYNVPGVNKPGLSKKLSWFYDRMAHQNCLFSDTMVSEAHSSINCFRRPQDPPPLPPAANPDYWPPWSDSQVSQVEEAATHPNEPPIDQHNTALLLNVVRNTSSNRPVNSVVRSMAPPGLTRSGPPPRNHQQLSTSSSVVATPLQGSSSSSSRNQQTVPNYSVDEAELEAVMAIVMGNHDD